MNLQAQYDIDKHTTLAVTGRNLLDADYQLTDGFPEPGRSFVANVKATF